MTYVSEINIMPHKEILDPQGKAVKLGLNNLGLNTIDNVRIGKHITLEIDAANESEASEKVEMACKKLLANLIMESYTFELKQK